MEYDFLITLRSPRINLFGYIAQLMLFLAALAFTFHLFDAIPVIYKVFYGIVTVATIAFWMLARFGVLSNHEHYTSYRIALLIATLGWLMAPMPLQLVAILFIVSALLEKPVNTPAEIGFNKDGLTFNSFPQKFIPWEQITNVVLRDDLLTIDYKNNKLFQRLIDPGTEAAVEKEFNSFCAAHTGIA